MEQLNVRNVDNALWQEVKRSAAASGRTVGDMLNEILADWALRKSSGPPADARERAQKAMGLFKDLGGGPTSGTDFLHKLREIDRRREDELFASYAADEPR